MTKNKTKAVAKPSPRNGAKPKPTYFQGYEKIHPVQVSHAEHRDNLHHKLTLDRTKHHDAIRVIMGPNSSRIAQMLIDAEARHNA